MVLPALRHTNRIMRERGGTALALFPSARVYALYKFLIPSLLLPTLPLLGHGHHNTVLRVGLLSLISFFTFRSYALSCAKSAQTRARLPSLYGY